MLTEVEADRRPPPDDHRYLVNDSIGYVRSSRHTPEVRYRFHMQVMKATNHHEVIG